MAKHTYLEFEDNEKLNAFMRLIFPPWYDHDIFNSTIGSKFKRDEIKIAVEQFGAKVVEKPRPDQHL
jgi:hypothetical protein